MDLILKMEQEEVVSRLCSMAMGVGRSDDVATFLSDRPTLIRSGL